MSSSKLAAWFSGLLRGRQPEAAVVAPGRRVVEIGAAATAAVEGAICDALCLSADAPGAPATHGAARNVFGRSVRELRAATDAAAVDAALGMALTGRRVAAWVHGSRLPAVHDRLLQAVGRRAPIVLHAELGALARESATDATAHDGLHALADAGAFVAIAADAQEAVDLTVVARRVAELSLTPGIVAMDAMETSRGLQDLLLPEPAALRDLVGAPDDDIAAPTPAQRLLFGETRARVPAWISLDRPLSLGGVATHEEAGAALAGHGIFFGRHLPAIIAEACDAWARRTGRAMGMVRRHRLDDARHVVVAQGSLVEMAEAAADAAREQGRRVGVLGITWLRPFPTDAVRQALARAESVTVLERSCDALASGPPLTREIRAALAGGRARVMHAIVGAAGVPITAGQLLSACGEGLADGLRAGTPIASLRTEFPKRQAALQALQKAHPEIDAGLLAAGAADLRGGARTLVLCRRADSTDDARLQAIGRAFSEAAGPSVRGRWIQVEADGFVARVNAGGTSVRDGGDGDAADLVVVDGLAGAWAVPPPAWRDGAAVAIVTDIAPRALAARLPRRWRVALRERTARACVVTDAAALDVAALKALLSGECSLFAPLDVAALSASEDAPEPGAPAFLRRFGADRAACDSLPRHHGEVAQPRLLGEVSPAVPEPRLSVAVAPAGAAALAARGQDRACFPTIDAALCTGCGRCWTECPDSAIGARALRTQVLLTAAAGQSGVASPQAERLRRSHRQLAAHVDALLAERGARSLDAALLREASDAFVPRLGVSGDDLAATRAALDATLACVVPALPLSVTRLLHAAPHAASNGTGDLLLLAVDPRSCQGCGGCAVACGEQAIRMEPVTAERVAREGGRWAQWEALPDTPADAVARASALPEIGPLAGALLSRDIHLAMSGGDAAEPGSGERLALRQVTAVAAQQSLRALEQQSAKAESLASRLAEAVRAALAAGLPATDLEALSAALHADPSGRAPLAGVLARIERTPSSPRLDAAAARRLVSSAIAMRALHERWTRSVDGLGRAPMAVVAGPSVGTWLAGFPGTSLHAPLLVESAGGAAALARGIAEGMMDDALGEHRQVLFAELALDAPADIESRQERLAELAWRDMPAEALAAVAPLLLVLSSDALGPAGLAGLLELLASDLPVKVLLLDRLDARSEAADPALAALAQQRAFVVSASVAHGAHLHDGVRRALLHRGPALVRVHAPSPSKDGFAPDRTVERAREAVESRAHVLLVFDPAAPGVFGSKLSLEGNPAPDRTWAAAAPDPLDVALQRRAQRWTLLQELAGIVTPFTERIREEARSAVQARHSAELAALEAAHSERLAEVERASRERMAAQIKANLLELVARAPRAGVIGGGAGPS